MRTATIMLAVPAAPVSRTATPVDPTTAYVVSHVTQALESLRPSTILFEKTTRLCPGSGLGVEYSWSTPDRTRSQSFTGTGQLATDESLTYTATTVTHLVVDYRTKTWSRITFWVNATTYLPVRIVQVWASTPLSVADLQMDMQWLPATPAHEAKLTVPIPAGFPQVPW